MSRIEEAFDDDTDLPLVPPLGPRGPLLQQLEDDDEGPRAGPASRQERITDTTPYKSWTCIYPIYLDAKRPYGQRRVARAKSVWWPLSKDIAAAASRLGLGTLHEVNKTHPRDWENPGRVRVQWKKDGRPLSPLVQNKKQLLDAIALQIQHRVPTEDTAPQPPQLSAYSPTVPSGVLIDTITAAMDAAEPAAAAPPVPGKGKRKVVRVRG